MGLVVLQSREDQLKGETKAGIEIKFDDKCETTGNLYIETAEKTNPNDAEFRPSGRLSS